MKKFNLRQIKPFLSLTLAVILFFSLTNPLLVVASAASSKDEWKTNNGYEYPLTPADSAWASLSYSEQLDACDMPVDMLSNCSTEELADLVLEYPFLIDILAFDNADLAIKHFIDSSNICAEFFSRDNITDVLIMKYDEMNVNYENLINESNVMPVSDSGYIGELFLQTYFAYAMHSLTDAQAQEVSKIIGEKHEAKKGICEDFATSLLIYDWIQIDNGEIPRYLVPECIEQELNLNENSLTMGKTEIDLNQNRAASGFTSSGNVVQFTINKGLYTVGTYSLYGKTVGCYKFYSNEYTPDETKYLNSTFDNAHSSWSRVYTCTKKYNCHSYTWINSSSSNVYWLTNPDGFASSGEFTLVGKNIDKPAPSLSVGDKIIVGASVSSDDGFGNVTYSAHSANVLSTTGSTQSKLGSYGVYIAPADDLVKFYTGYYYLIYR